MNCLIGCPSCYRGLLASFILLTRLSIDICSEIGRTSQGGGLVRQTAAPAVRGSVAVRGSPDPAQVADRKSPSRFLPKDRPAWSRHVGSGDLRSGISARSGDLRRAPVPTVASRANAIEKVTRAAGYFHSQTSPSLRPVAVTARFDFSHRFEFVSSLR